MKWEQRMKTGKVGIVGGRRLPEMRICGGGVGETVDILKRTFVHGLLSVPDP